ncbi:MAG: hypothetical protein JSV50_11765 [Desulfobacteraceae bacterium]|nr:MAG: hypothetical protein JSV50_11765 [Desulfobacteraceae bacterium]
MAKKRRKRKAPEKETYEIEVEEWEVYYYFGITPKTLNDTIRGTYWEIKKLTLLDKIISPELKNATKAIVDLSAEPEQDDHWSEKPTILSAKAIGFMEIPRGEEFLHVYCSVPPRFSNHIHMAIASGKIKCVSIFGTKLKWRKGTTFSITLSTNREEE